MDILDLPLDGSNRIMGSFPGFPNHLCQSEDERKMLLASLACCLAVAWMHDALAYALDSNYHILYEFKSKTNKVQRDPMSGRGVLFRTQKSYSKSKNLPPRRTASKIGRAWVIAFSKSLLERANLALRVLRSILLVLNTASMIQLFPGTRTRSSLEIMSRNASSEPRERAA